METIDIIMLIGLLLMITALVLMYRCARKDRPVGNGRTCRSPCFGQKDLHTSYSDSITCWK